MLRLIEQRKVHVLEVDDLDLEPAVLARPLLEPSRDGLAFSSWTRADDEDLQARHPPILRRRRVRGTRADRDGRRSRPTRGALGPVPARPSPSVPCLPWTPTAAA